MAGVGEESGAANSQAALFEQVQEFLAAVTRRGPVVLILEDLHWSDPASLELLRFVSRNLDGLRALLVVTYRDDETPANFPSTGYSRPWCVNPGRSGSNCAGWASRLFGSWWPPDTGYPSPTKGGWCPT